MRRLRSGTTTALRQPLIAERHALFQTAIAVVADTDPYPNRTTFA
jgi:hypothetical protein